MKWIASLVYTHLYFSNGWTVHSTSLASSYCNTGDSLWNTTRQRHTFVYNSEILHLSVHVRLSKHKVNRTHAQRDAMWSCAASSFSQTYCRIYFLLFFFKFWCLIIIIIALSCSNKSGIFLDIYKIFVL